MERFAEKLKDILNEQDFCFEPWEIKVVEKALNRFAAYENTGLEPKEIQAIAGIASENCAKTADAIDKLLQDDAELESYRDLGPIDHLRELVQADQEGKFPKYTIGDTVYDRFGCAWEVTSVELHSIRTKNEWLYRCGHKGTDDYRALWHFEAFPNKETALRREQDEKGGSSE